MEKANRKHGKAGKVFAGIGIALAVLLALYALFCAVAGPLFYPDFYREAERLEPIPGLWNGFIPQGVTTLPGTDAYLICGYMEKGASRIYRMNGDGTHTEILLNKADGSVYTGHAGGITATDDYVYISNASKLFVLNADDVRRASNGDTLTFIGQIEVPCRASFCSNDGTMVYVGEYHADGYETEESHRVETDGEVYRAIVFGYRLDKDTELGIADQQTPAVAYAICDKAQGFAIAPDGIASVSCSWGLNDSVLRQYGISGEPDGALPFGETELPLYVLDAHRAVRTLSMPHMSEDLETANGYLWVGFEAGARKYGAGLLPFSIGSVVRFDLRAK